MWCYLHLCLIIPVILILLLLIDVRKPNSFPPGPPWLPIIGCYRQVNSLYAKKKFYHLVWAHFHQVYGSVVGLKLGCDRIVIVSGYEAVKQVLCGEVFEGRPDGFFFRLRSLGDRLGVVFVDGPFMHEQRKFSIHQLRNFGLGKAPMFDIITKEALEIVELIMSKYEDGPIQIQQLFDVGTLNALWTMIAGYRFSLNDAKLLKLLDLVNAAFHLVDASGGLLNQMPFLRFLAPSISGYNSLTAIVNEMMDFLQDIVKKHQELDGNDFISIFLREVRNNENDKDSSFTEKQLMILLEDFFMAGTETTSSTLSFVIFYLIKYPEVQTKIHVELDRVVGRNQIPTVELRDRLIFLDATIMEIQRHANPVPVTIPHKALKDTELMGFKIPKGTCLLPSLWSVHMDETHWNNPHEFVPERFIDDNGKLIQNSHFMPFGIGRRRCIGEVLAKTSLFLFLSILLHKFKIEPAAKEVPTDILDGVTLVPAPFKVRFVPRA